MCYLKLNYLCVWRTFEILAGLPVSYVSIPDMECPIQPPIQCVPAYRGSLPGVKWPKCEVAHTSASNSEVENEWSYYSTRLIPSWHEQG
jgi:hypothetical protein